MNKKYMAVVALVISCVSPVWAGDAIETLPSLREQARDERMKERDIQILRLELEKLKVEMEKRKLMNDMGMPGKSSQKTDEPGIDQVTVISILIDSMVKKAVVDLNGFRRTICVGDWLGSMRVKDITADKVVFIDDKGMESVFALGI